MKTKTEYKRDSFDGEPLLFEKRLQKPENTEKYYDDMVKNHSGGENPIQFVFFGKEQSYPNRSHINRKTKGYLIHYITEGEGTFNGNRITAGMGFVVFPGEEHTMIADSENPWHFFWLEFRGSDAQRLLTSVGLNREKQVFTYGFADALSALFDDVIYAEHPAADMDTYMLGCFYILISYHRKQYLDERAKLSGTRGYAVRAAEYIDAKYGENVRIDELAKKMHISRKYLCQLFKAYNGVSPKEYLLERRIEAACVLLTSTEMSVPEIAHAVGYSDYTLLTRLFVRRCGQSPLKYRKSAREVHNVD